MSSPDIRVEQYLNLIRALSENLGSTAYPTLAGAAEHLLALFNRGTNGAGVFTPPTSRPAYTPPKDLPRKQKASSKVPVSELLLEQLEKLNNSGLFVKTARRHKISVNSIRRAIDEKFATADMISKLTYMIENPTGEIVIDESKVVSFNDEIHNLGALAS
jgi:hypothetical protein